MTDDIRKTVAYIIESVDNGTREGQSNRWENIFPSERDQIVEALFNDPRLEISARGNLTDGVLEVLSRVLAKVSSLAPYGMEMNVDGSEDKLAAAYVEGVRDAHEIVSDALKTAREDRT